jgi:hypothetical protein
MDIPRESLPNIIYVIDHHKSDPNTHVYCQACRDQIPTFLNRYEFVHTDWNRILHDEFDYCEGCGRRLRPDKF